MHDLLRETNKKINGVENYYDRAQRSNTALAQEWTKEGSRSASAIGQRLESKQQSRVSSSAPCYTGRKRGPRRIYQLTLGFMVNKRQSQDWNTVSLILNPMLFLKEKEKRREKIIQV